MMSRGNSSVMTIVFFIQKKFHHIVRDSLISFGRPVCNDLLPSAIVTGYGGIGLANLMSINLGILL